MRLEGAVESRKEWAAMPETAAKDDKVRGQTKTSPKLLSTLPKSFYKFDSHVCSPERLGSLAHSLVAARKHNIGKLELVASFRRAARGCRRSRPE